MSTPPSILVFDSGVGGLSILAEIEQQLPSTSLIYASDNEAFPYGTKPEQFIVDRVRTMLRSLITKTNPDLIVIACNTASTVALPALRSEFDLPIVGVVPAIKTAARLSKTRVIGLLATPATIARPYTNQLIRDFASDCTCLRVGSTELVEMAEAHLRGIEPDPARTTQIIAPLFEPTQNNQFADVIVLGCTHFPLMLPALRAAAPRSIEWIDSGHAIARRVESLLSPQLAKLKQDTAHTKTVWFARNDPNADSLRPLLTQLGFQPARFLHIAPP